MPRALNLDSISPVEEDSLTDTETQADVDDFGPAAGPEQSLLNNQCLKAHSERELHDYKMTPMGRLRAYWLGIIVCIGGFLCTIANSLTRSSLANANSFL